MYYVVYNTAAVLICKLQMLYGCKHLVIYIDLESRWRLRADHAWVVKKEQVLDAVARWYTEMKGSRTPQSD